jgi:hypothetical protein
MEKAKLSVRCLDYVRIDQDTAMVTVLETWLEPVFVWWFQKVHAERTYTGLIRDRIWVDPEGRILPGGSFMAVELWSIAVQKEMERRIDKYTAQI